MQKLNLAFSTQVVIIALHKVLLSPRQPLLLRSILLPRLSINWNSTMETKGCKLECASYSIPTQTLHSYSTTSTSTRSLAVAQSTKKCITSQRKNMTQPTPTHQFLILHKLKSYPYRFFNLSVIRANNFELNCTCIEVFSLQMLGMDISSRRHNVIWEFTAWYAFFVNSVNCFGTFSNLILFEVSDMS